MTQCLVKKLRDDAILPTQATNGSAGADIRACLFDEETGEKITKIKIPAGGKIKVHTGLAFQLPENHVMLIFPRSSMGVKKGLMLCNTTGVLDSDYRGECLLFVKNTSDEPIEIEDGERIAQLVFNKVEEIEWSKVETLEETERKGGFGHTGTH